MPKKEENVVVAVRLRPFIPKDNDDDREYGSVIEITEEPGVPGGIVEIFPPEEFDREVRRTTFPYDYVYWPRPGMKLKGNDDLWAEMGTKILDNLFTSYNTTLFAYGATGSGKSYSMIGDDKSPGLVRRVLRELRNAIVEKKMYEKYIFEAQMTVVEIYLEKVNDLLTRADDEVNIINGEIPSATRLTVDLFNADERKEWGLELKKRGPRGARKKKRRKDRYKIGLKDVAASVDTFLKNRTLRETHYNDTSSRSHTVVTFYIKKTDKQTGSVTSMKVNLVDLAGNEGAEAADIKDDYGNVGRDNTVIQEGRFIRQSLLSLVQVMKDLSAGKKLPGYAFRKTKLTLLLRNSLQGSARVIMLGTIHPNASRVGHSLATLHFANSVKKIKLRISRQKAKGGTQRPQVITKVDNTALEKLRKEKAELQRNFDRLSQLRESDQSRVSDLQDAIDAKMSRIERLEAELMELKRQEEEDKEDDKVLPGILKTEDDSFVRAMRVMAMEKQFASAFAHLANLDPDPMQSGRVKHFLQPTPSEEYVDKLEDVKALSKFPSEDLVTRVISPAYERDEKNDGRDDQYITLHGLKIRPMHASVYFDAERKKCILECFEGADVYVNGNQIKHGDEAGYTLRHNDRVVFGLTHFFVFVDPAVASKLSSSGGGGGEDVDDGTASFAEAQAEFYERVSPVLVDPKADKENKERLERQEEELGSMRSKLQQLERSSESKVSEIKAETTLRIEKLKAQYETSISQARGAARDELDRKYAQERQALQEEQKAKEARATASLMAEKERVSKLEGRLQELQDKLDEKARSREAYKANYRRAYQLACEATAICVECDLYHLVFKPYIESRPEQTRGGLQSCVFVKAWDIRDRTVPVLFDLKEFTNRLFWMREMHVAYKRAGKVVVPDQMPVNPFKLNVYDSPGLIGVATLHASPFIVHMRGIPEGVTMDIASYEESAGLGSQGSLEVEFDVIAPRRRTRTSGKYAVDKYLGSAGRLKLSIVKGERIASKYSNVFVKYRLWCDPNEHVVPAVASQYTCEFKYTQEISFNVDEELIRDAKSDEGLCVTFWVYGVPSNVPRITEDSTNKRQPLLEADEWEEIRSNPFLQVSGVQENEQDEGDDLLKSIEDHLEGGSDIEEAPAHESSSEDEESKDPDFEANDVVNLHNRGTHPKTQEQKKNEHDAMTAKLLDEIYATLQEEGSGDEAGDDADLQAKTAAIIAHFGKVRANRKDLKARLARAQSLKDEETKRMQEELATARQNQKELRALLHEAKNLEEARPVLDDFDDPDSVSVADIAHRYGGSLTFYVEPSGSESEASVTGRNWRPRLAKKTGFETATGECALMLEIVSGTDLVDMDTFSHSDPFLVVIPYDKDWNELARFQTSYIKSNLNPTWNATFDLTPYTSRGSSSSYHDFGGRDFDPKQVRNKKEKSVSVKLKNADQRYKKKGGDDEKSKTRLPEVASVLIQVWDYDSILSNDFMGQVVVPINAIPKCPYNWANDDSEASQEGKSSSSSHRRKKYVVTDTATTFKNLTLASRLAKKDKVAGFISVAFHRKDKLKLTKERRSENSRRRRSRGAGNNNALSRKYGRPGSRGHTRLGSVGQRRRTGVRSTLSRTTDGTASYSGTRRRTRGQF